MAQLIVMGSGTALPDADRGNSGYCWDSPEGVLLLDCGGTPYQRLLSAGVDPLRVRAVFLSHSHPDHITGLPPLLFHLWLRRYEGRLVVLGNRKTISVARAYTNALRCSEHMITPEWQVVAGEGGPVELPYAAGVTMTTVPTIHTRPTLAVRLDHQASGKSLVYSADTDFCEPLIELARGAQLLVHECAVGSPFKSHSTPEQVAEVALRAGAERLVIIHYSPIHTCPEEELLERIRKAGYAGEVEIGRDGARYSFDEGHPQAE